MEELEVPVLDFYLATHLSADWLRPHDGRHYEDAFNRKISDYFFEQKSFAVSVVPGS